MSIRTTSSPELPRAQAPKVESTPGGWQSIPHINQLRPNGADAHYVNGAYNCAPAVVAMLARGAGKQSGLTDAQLINQLGNGVVTANGTTPQGLAVMLGRAGIPIEGKAMAGNYSDEAVQKHLKQGHMLIAQVALTGASQEDASAHYVLIRGVNAQGNYVISDPMASGVSVVTPDQLRSAIDRAPPDGGLLVPVGGPASTTKPTSQLPPLMRPKSPRDVFNPFSKPGPSPSKPSVTPPQGTQVQGQTLNAGTLASMSDPNSLLGALASAQPDMAAFSVSDAAFEGIDTSFQAGAGAGKGPLSYSELRNVMSLDIDYGAQGAHLSLLTGIMPVTGRDKTIPEIVQDLRERKQNNDPSVDKLLERLESSIAMQDIMVLAMFKQAELKDPGIGKKTSTDPM